MSATSELRDRLNDARVEVERLRNSAAAMHAKYEHSRLAGKVEGIDLALSYLAEMSCRECSGLGFIVIPEHACGGDERACESSCPVPNQAACPSCSPRPEREPLSAGYDPNEEPF
jgi:hypothetical protein